MRAVVLGAGPAGLAAAQALLDGGAHVTLLEAAPRVGGLSKSFLVGGHWVDLGPHRLHLDSSTRVRQLLGGAGGLSVRPRRGRIHFGTRSVAYPLRPLSVLRGLGPVESSRFALSALAAPLARHTDSYAGETRRRVGGALFDALYAPAARKIWGVEPECLDAGQARARVGAQSPGALLLRALGRSDPGCYLYPTDGACGFAYDAWARRLRARGVEVLTSTRATRVLTNRLGVCAVQARCGSSERSLLADRVVSTLPLNRLSSMLVPAGELRPNQLSFRSVIALHLVLNRARVSAEDVHYFPGSATPFARVAEQAAFGRAAGSPLGQSVITLDLYDDRDGPLVHATVEELVEVVLPHLADLGIGAGDVLHAERNVAHDAYPVMTRGFTAARNELLDTLCSVEGLISTGRAGLFLHVNQHHAIEMGVAAGAAALRRDDVSARWRALARRFEGMRIVD